MKAKYDIPDDVCALLGKSRKEILDMGLRELAALLYDKGLRIGVSTHEVAQDEGGVRFRIVSDQTSINI